MAQLLRIDPTSLPLTEYCVYSGTDYTEASRVVSGISENRSLTLVNEMDAPSYIELHRAQLNYSQIAVTANTAATQLHINVPLQHFVLVLPLCGYHELATPNGPVKLEPGQASLSVVGQTLKATRSPRYVALVASLSRKGYEKLFGNAVDDVMLDLNAYPKVLSVTSNAFSSMLSILGTLCCELNEEANLYSRQNQVIARLEEALWMRFIDLYPALEPQLVGKKSNQVLPSYIKKAKEYINDHAKEEIRLSTMVELTGVSARSLQSGFNAAFGCSPRSYIRKAKLSGIKRDLLNACPETTQVSDVAATWGMYHLGNLAHHYRAEFGELPSDTLKRNED